MIARISKTMKVPQVVLQRVTARVTSALVPGLVMMIQIQSLRKLVGASIVKVASQFQLKKRFGAGEDYSQRSYQKRKREETEEDEETIKEKKAHAEKFSGITGKANARSRKRVKKNAKILCKKKSPKWEDAGRRKRKTDEPRRRKKEKESPRYDGKVPWKNCFLQFSACKNFSGRSDEEAASIHLPPRFWQC